jgi:hypothetical protein
MHITIVINVNEYVFINFEIFIPKSHNITKHNMKLLFMDLYSTTNHVGAKNGLPLEGRSYLEKNSQSFFTLIYC